MRSLFVMDPLDQLNVAGDSTYVLMRECTDRGHPVAWCTPGDLFARDGRAGARVQWVRTTEAPPYFHPERDEALCLSEFDAVWMRKDPPFDMDYVFATFLLEMVPPTTLVLNEPAGLRLYNEKMWAATFLDLHPPTLLSRDPERIRAFVDSQPTGTVLKPWDGNGGRGIVVTGPGDRNLGPLIELLTDNHRSHLIAQTYIEAIREGDRRIILYEGEPVGILNRVPGELDHRGNMHVGARVEPTEMRPRDVEICRVLAPELNSTGMVFVGIDVIGDFLTEINVTSPTGLRELNAMYDVCLEADLVDRVERLSAARVEKQ